MAAPPRGVKRAGPRTKIGDRDLKVGDLVLFRRDDSVDVLAQATGGYRLEETWYLQLGPCPGTRGGSREYHIPQSIKLADVKTIWGRGR